jgi:DNA repair protein RadC
VIGKKDMHIKDWPEGDRPREMLLEKGNAIALAREMIVKFGGLNVLMMTTSENLSGKSPL